MSSDILMICLFHMKPSPTNETTVKILDFFLSAGIFARRHGVAAGQAEYTNKAGDTKGRFIHGGISGGSDIFAFLPPNGRFLGVEIKTGHDYLKPNQIGFNRQIEMMGGRVLVVKDFEDFLFQFKKLYPQLTVDKPRAIIKV